MAVCCVVVTPFEAARIGSVQASEISSGAGGPPPTSLLSLIAAKAVDPLVYSGLPSLILKDVPFHATKFAVFDVATSSLKGAAASTGFALNPVVLTLCAGVVAGVTAAVVSQPGDATFTKCNISGEGVKRLSPPDAFRDLLRNGGLTTGLSSR